MIKRKEGAPTGEGTEKKVLIVSGPYKLDYYTASELSSSISEIGGVAVKIVSRDYQVEDELDPESGTNPDVVIGDGKTYTRDASGDKVPIYYSTKRRAKKAGARYVRFGKSQNRNMRKIEKAINK